MNWIVFYILMMTYALFSAEKERNQPVVAAIAPLEKKNGLEKYWPTG